MWRWTASRAEVGMAPRLNASRVRTSSASARKPSIWLGKARATSDSRCAKSLLNDSSRPGNAILDWNWGQRSKASWGCGAGGGALRAVCPCALGHVVRHGV